MLAEQCTRLDDVSALCECSLRWVIDEISVDAPGHHRTGRLRLQISESSVTVLGMRAAALQRMTAALITGLAARHGRTVPTTIDETLGAAVTAVLHHAFVRWLEEDDPDAFERIARERLSVFRRNALPAPDDFRL